MLLVESSCERLSRMAIDVVAISKFGSTGTMVELVRSPDQYPLEKKRERYSQIHRVFTFQPANSTKPLIRIIACFSVGFSAVMYSLLTTSIKFTDGIATSGGAIKKFK